MSWLFHEAMFVRTTSYGRQLTTLGAMVTVAPEYSRADRQFHDVLAGDYFRMAHEHPPAGTPFHDGAAISSWPCWAASACYPTPSPREHESSLQCPDQLLGH
jgi:hypothetical protein